MAEFSEEKIEFFKEYLNKKAKEPKCSFCHADKFTINKDESILMNSVLGGYLCFSICCNDCGKLQIFHVRNTMEPFKKNNDKKEEKKSGWFNRFFS